MGYLMVRLVVLCYLLIWDIKDLIHIVPQKVVLLLIKTAVFENNFRRGE